MFRQFTFSDHCHEKLDISADYTDFVRHVATKIDNESDDNVTLSEDIVLTDATLDASTSDDPKSTGRKRRRTDNNETLPEKIRKLIFDPYTLSYLNYSGR